MSRHALIGIGASGESPASIVRLVSAINVKRQLKETTELTF